MMNGHDDIREFDPRLLPTANLRSLVRSQENETERIAAISALCRRVDLAAAEMITDLTAVLRSRDEVPSLRYAAAVELGRLATAESSDVLLDVLSMAVTRDESALVIRGAAAALLQVGRVPVTEIIALVAEWPEVLASLRLLLTMHAFRHDLEPGEVAAPPIRPADLTVARVRRDQANAMNFQAAPPAIVQQVREGAQHLLSGEDLDERGASLIQCGEQRLAFVPTAGSLAVESMLGRLKRRSVAGVVSVHYHLESDSWEPKYVLITQPGPRAKGKPRLVQLVLLDTTGVPAYVGDATVTDSGARWTMRAVRKPGAIPARLKGRVEKGRLVVQEAVSELRKVDRRQPRLLSAPRRL